MNYAKLCPGERSHMFIMKAAGVLEIPRVAPNELHVTGRRDTQHDATAAGGEKKNTTFPRCNGMHSSGNLDWVLTGLVFYCSTRKFCHSRTQTVWLAPCAASGASGETALTDFTAPPQHQVTPEPELKHGGHFVAKCLQQQPACAKPPLVVFICV